MNKNIVILMFIQVFIYLGFGIIIPIVPEIMVNLGVRSIHLGGLLSIYSVASFIVAPFWGAISDRYGRKSIIMIGLIGYAVSFILFGVYVDNLIWLYTSRVMSGLFSGALYAASISYVADVTEPENRTKSMGFIGMSIGLGFIFGPSIGGLLSQFGLSIPFYTSAILLLILTVTTFFILPESKNREQAVIQGRMIGFDQWKRLSNRMMLSLFAFTFIATLLIAGLEATFQLFEIVNIGITPVQIGLLFLISGLVDALVQGGIVPLIKNGKESSWIMSGQLVTGIGLLFIPFTNSLWTAGVALALFTAGNALVRTCVVSLITIHAGHRQGLATGISYSLDSLGRVIGPLFFTLVFEIHHISTFIILSMIAFVSISLIIYYDKQQLISEFQLTKSN